MQKGVVLSILILIILAPAAFAGIYGVTIGSTDYACQDIGDTPDGICPSDYASCDACLASDGSYVDDPDCCSPMVCSFVCNDSGEVCGDSTDETIKYETDSEGDDVDGTGSGNGVAEDCSGTCTAGTENVLDDENSWACLDTAYDDPDSCTDDETLYDPISATSDVCSTDVSCHDTDDDGDLEVCFEGNWHDPDEAEEYCTAAGGSWETGSGTSTEDDYDADLSNGYCLGDDGYDINGAIVAEVSRGSDYCEAGAEESTGTEVTVRVVSTEDTSTTIDSVTTTYESTWAAETIGCHEDSSDNDVGSYEFTLSAGDYYLIAEAEGYNTVTNLITVSAEETFSAFWMYLSEGCQADCTMNDGVCYASCDGTNGCAFETYDETGESVSVYCDGMSEGARYVLSEETDEEDNSVYGWEVYCCTGTPQEYDREYFSADDAETNCVEDIISKEKGYWLNGEFVTFHFVLFDDPDPTKDGCDEYETFMCDMYGGGFC